MITPLFLTDEQLEMFKVDAEIRRESFVRAASAFGIPPTLLGIRVEIDDTLPPGEMHLKSGDQVVKCINIGVDQ